MVIANKWITSIAVDFQVYHLGMIQILHLQTERRGKVIKVGKKVWKIPHQGLKTLNTQFSVAKQFEKQYTKKI